MKYSILGTNGFLANAIAKHCIENNIQLDMYGLKEPVGFHVDHYYKVNLMDAELDCSTLLSSDIIIYAIGAGIQSNLNESSDSIYHLNVTVPVSICNSLKQQGYKGTFVTFGSYFEIGVTKKERFFTEEDVLSSMSPAPNDYTVSKRMLSTFVSSYKHDFTHWHFFIPTIYGAGENPKRLIPYVINAIRNGEELHFTTGDQTRQYVHVSEVPRMLAMAIEHSLPSGAYNIQGYETLTVKELVSLIHHAMGKEVPEGCYGCVQRADEGMKYLALDGKRLKKYIGFSPIISINRSIREYY